MPIVSHGGRLARLPRNNCDSDGRTLPAGAESGSTGAQPGFQGENIFFSISFVTVVASRSQPKNDLG